ncbi:MAG TPA: lysozyme inhibitor LprI family protein [Candidatus Angelobacter sp.]
MNLRSIKQFAFYACFCLTLAAASAQTAGSSKDCLASANNQLDLNQCAEADASAADRDLNRTYQLIAKKYADQPLFLERLHESQRAWLKYRDAQVEMKFPTSAKQTAETTYGSVYPMCYAAYKAKLAKERTRELREWLVGIEEGDVCYGSAKTPASLK